ncbi:alpha/beta fold hydrolase [soil metagenome]
MAGEREEILIPGSGRQAVLLLHGLFGTPNELHVLGGALSADGHTVLIPLLPGRGARGSDMDALSWDDWMGAALGAFDRLARDHDRVAVGGLSAGGTMALDLALRRPVAALMLYAAALSLRLRAAYLAPYLWRVVRPWRSPRTSAGDPVRMRAVAELVRGMRRVRPRLAEIEAPALVMHAARDPFVPSANAHELARRLGGQVELVIVGGAAHAITAGVGRDDVARRTRLFLDPSRAPRHPVSANASRDR